MIEERFRRMSGGFECPCCRRMLHGTTQYGDGPTIGVVCPDCHSWSTWHVESQDGTQDSYKLKHWVAAKQETTWLECAVIIVAILLAIMFLAFSSGCYIGWTAQDAAPLTNEGANLVHCVSKDEEFCCVYYSQKRDCTITLCLDKNNDIWEKVNSTCP